jgi:hypothetical protein
VPKEALSFADAGSGMVYGGIQSRGDMTFDILGDTFLKGIYAVSRLASCALRILSAGLDFRSRQPKIWRDPAN